MNEQVVLTAEEQKEERLNQMKAMAQAAFPDNRVEKDGSYIRITSTRDMFIGSEIKKVEAISSLHGCNGFFLSASVTSGLQAVLF